MKRITLVSVLLSIAISGLAGTNSFYRPITNESMFFKIVTEEITNFSVENADLLTCIETLTELTRVPIILLGSDKQLSDKIVSIELKDVTLDQIIKIISLYYHVDYTIAPKSIAIHPLDRHQCDLMTMKKYHIPLTHIIDFETLNTWDSKAKVSRFQTAHHHGMVYNEEEETLFVKTCIPQQRFIEAWLASTVPNFGKQNSPNQNEHNQQVDPIVKTPVDEVEAQGTQGHP